MSNKIITIETLNHFKTKYDTQVDDKIKKAVPTANEYATTTDIDNLFTTSSN